jgi:hypothetical protein
MRRFTRLTNAFSKKVENHACAVALHAMYYNFVRIHQTLKVTPAMAAGVTDRLWEMADLVEMLEAFEASQKTRPAPSVKAALFKLIHSTDPLPALDCEHIMNYVHGLFLSSGEWEIMVRALVEEAATLASLALFLGMIAIWAQIIATL